MSNPAYHFGKKLAKYVEFYEREPKTPGQKQKLPDHQVFNNALMRAESAGESPSVDLFNRIGKEHDEQKEQEEKESAAYKFGKSMCQPCDMSKHDRSKYQTGPMRALSAEEAIKPADGGVTETQETEHSEKAIANSGQKTSKYKQAAGGKGGLGGMFGGIAADAARSLTRAAPPTLPTAAARPKLPTTRTSAGTAAPSWIRNNQAIASGIDPKTGLKPGAVAPPPPPPSAPTARDYGRVPTGAVSTAQAQSFFDGATSGGRQRMLGIDPQGRGVPSAPQSWAQLSPEQQAAVQKFYTGGQ